MIFLLSTMLDSLKCAVGPHGKCTTRTPFMVLRSSLNTMRSVKPLLLAYCTIFFKGKPCRTKARSAGADPP